LPEAWALSCPIFACSQGEDEGGKSSVGGKREEKCLE